MLNNSHNLSSTQPATPLLQKGRNSVLTATQPHNTGDLSQGLCYLITLFTNDSFTAEEYTHISSQRSAILSRLTEAGIKGARSKIKEGNEDLATLFTHYMEPILNQEQGEDSLLLTVPLWKQWTEKCEGCHLLTYSVRKNHVHLLLRWGGEHALMPTVETWKAQINVTWAPQVHSLQIDEKDISRYLDLVLADQANETAFLLSQEQNLSEQSTEEGTDINFHHVTVLLHEAVQMLEPCEGKVIVDATLGGGGHTEQLLEHGATVIGIDQDPDARKAAAKRLSRFGQKFRILAGNFRDIEQLLTHENITHVDGILADIGVSSHQIDTASRGFSFREDGPLDMRMSPNIKQSAADIINTAAETELARIFWEYGEERASRSLARLIVKTREEAPITTTAQLAKLAERAIPRKGGHHPGTKAFQALRIAVNDELGALTDLLQASIHLLAPKGRLALITFHSLEDRCVKRFFDQHSKPEIDRPEWPAPRPNPEFFFTLINKKPLTASEAEIKINPRSRSAKLRGGIRTTN